MKTQIGSLTKAILFTGVVAGTLDILAAIYILAGGHAERVFRFIAKGAIGVKAFTGGFEKVLRGGFFHYLIAISFTAGYFLVFPKMKVLQKNWIGSGVFYGVFVWSFMQFIVLPQSNNPPQNLTWEVWKGIAILIVSVGLPIAWSAKTYFKN